MSRVASKYAIIKDKTAVESGYVNNPNDLGGETIWGITYATSREPEYRHLWDKYKWNGNMKTMPIELAYDIYIIGWWDRMMLDDVFFLSPYLAERLFDFGINAGRKNAVMSLQRILNVHNRQGKSYADITADGIMGPKTFSTLEMYNNLNPKSDAMDKLILLMLSMQNYHYIDISEKRPANETFTNGWTNRVLRDFKYWVKSLV